MKVPGADGARVTEVSRRRRLAPLVATVAFVRAPADDGPVGLTDRAGVAGAGREQDVIRLGRSGQQ